MIPIGLILGLAAALAAVPIIGQDPGSILTGEDRALMTPASWICFDARQVTYRCGESWSDGGLRYSDLEVEGMLSGGIRHRFGPRHATEAVVCLVQRRDLRRVLSRARVACILGTNAGVDPDGSKGWVWDRIRTDRGCYSWFPGQCR